MNKIWKLSLALLGIINILFVGFILFSMLGVSVLPPADRTGPGIGIIGTLIYIGFPLTIINTIFLLIFLFKAKTQNKLIKFISIFWLIVSLWFIGVFAIYYFMLSSFNP